MIYLRQLDGAAMFGQVLLDQYGHATGVSRNTFVRMEIMNANSIKCHG